MVSPENFFRLRMTGTSNARRFGAAGIIVVPPTCGLGEVTSPGPTPVLSAAR